MSHPDDDLLVDLAINGSAASDATASASAADANERTAAHLGACPTCSATVADLRRTLALVTPEAADAEWVSPPAALWSSISAQLDRPVLDVSSTRSSAPAHASPTASGGDSVLELRRDRRKQGSQPSNSSRSGHGRHGQRSGVRQPARVGWTAGIAAAALVVGLLTGRALWREPAPSPEASPTTISKVALDTLNVSDPRQLGEATVITTAAGYALSIDTSKPLDADGGYLEVWLINRDGKRMVSVGVLRGQGPAVFPISQRLIDQGYVVVDISREQLDDNPAHSGDSIVRGELPA